MDKHDRRLLVGRTPQGTPSADAAFAVSPQRSSSADIAQAALLRRAVPVVGDTSRLKLTMTVVLGRETAQYLIARAMDEQCRLEDMVRNILESAADGGKPSPHRTAGMPAAVVGQDSVADSLRTPTGTV